MPLNRITGNAFSGSPLRRGYTPPQPSYERIQGISRRLQEVLASPGTGAQPLGLSPVGNGELFDQSKTTAEWREGMPIPQRVPMSAAVRQGPATRGEAGRIAGLEGLRGRIGLEVNQLQDAAADSRQWQQDRQQVFNQDWQEYARSAPDRNFRQSPLQPAPPEIDLSPAARNQRTSLGQGRMMPGGEQMQDRFMGGSPLAAQANYMAQGQAMEAAGLGVMVPGPYGQIGQFVENRQGVMEDVEASMPGRLLTPTDQPASGFTRRNEGGLAYTSRAQALRDAGQERAAQDLEAQQAARVEKVKEGRRAMGLPVGPAERRAERDQKKMDRMLKVQGRQLQRMGISPLSPQAALIAPEASERARKTMQGGAAGGASALTNAAGEPVTPVAQGAPRTATSMTNATEAYRALLGQTPLFKAAGVELGQEGGSPPPLNQVIPSVNNWLKKSGGELSERDLEGLHKLAIQAAHAANKDDNPFQGTRIPFADSSSTETWNSLALLEKLSKIPEKDTAARKQWWNEYSQSLQPSSAGDTPPSSPLTGQGYMEWLPKRFHPSEWMGTF